MSTPAPTLDVERELAARRGPGRRLVVGIDEVGRGALAGPVAVGACAIELMDGIAVPLPEGAAVLLAGGPLTDGALPTDTAVWLSL